MRHSLGTVKLREGSLTALVLHPEGDVLLLPVLERDHDPANVEDIALQQLGNEEA